MTGQLDPLESAWLRELLDELGVSRTITFPRKPSAAATVIREAVRRGDCDHSFDPSWVDAYPGRQYWIHASEACARCGVLFGDLKRDARERIDLTTGKNK